MVLATRKTHRPVVTMAAERSPRRRPGAGTDGYKKAGTSSAPYVRRRAWLTVRARQIDRNGKYKYKKKPTSQAESTGRRDPIGPRQQGKLRRHTMMGS